MSVPYLPSPRRVIRQNGVDTSTRRASTAPQHVLGERHDVVLLDEAHLDVELGELGLAIGAEVLVAIAPRDLVVAFQTADHEQLLEQLRRLRQGVPGTRLEPCGDQEVAGPLGRGTGHRRRLDLDEAVPVQYLARDPVDLAAQAHDAGRSLATQVEVAVAQPGLLTDLQPFVDRERQRRRLRQHLQLLTNTSMSPVGISVLVPGRRATSPVTGQYSERRACARSAISPSRRRSGRLRWRQSMKIPP